jgi:hypothetical protein
LKRGFEKRDLKRGFEKRDLKRGFEKRDLKRGFEKRDLKRGNAFGGWVMDECPKCNEPMAGGGLECIVCKTHVCDWCGRFKPDPRDVADMETIKWICKDCDGEN